MDATQRRNDRMNQMFEDARPGGKAPSCGHFPCTPEKAERDHSVKEGSIMTHTPGPWTVADSFGDIVGSDDRQVCKVTTSKRTGHEFDANARLIAASPTMYEALMQAALYLDDTTPASTTTRKRILAIIQQIEEGA